MEKTSRRRHIVSLSLPMVGGMLAENLFSLVDTAMVGRLGLASLAAVGACSFLYLLVMAIVFGLSTGVQTLVSREKIGSDGVFNGLGAGLVLAVLIGLPLGVVCYAAIPYLLPLVTRDPSVLAEGIPYLQARMVTAIAVGVNFSFRGFWNGIGKPSRFMTAVLIMSVANISLNYVLIFGKWGAPALGTLGAGVASACANVIGAVFHFWCVHRMAPGRWFRRPHAKLLKSILRLAIPSSMIDFFFAAGYVAFYSLVSRVGVAEMAAANVLLNITLVGALPAKAMGFAAMTLVGRSLGKKQFHEASRWGWDVCKLGVFSLTVLGLPLILFPTFVLSLFIQDQATVVLATVPLQLVGVSLGFLGASFILIQALLGAGDTTRVMVISIVLQWLVILPLVWLIGIYLDFGIHGIWSVQTFYAIAAATIFTQLWNRGKWKLITL